jgi:ABC-2 type transport system ATP-binding protein
MKNNSQSAIEVRGISKWYGQFQAVKDLEFDVQRGEIFALLGPNGAGKSTTIRMILDIIKPDTGSIAVLGGALDDARKSRIGYLPEERGLYKTARVLDMMIYLGQLKGMKAAAAKERALGYLKQLALSDYAYSKVDELSKGMQQKVQFAVTVLHEPDVIIIDEPFSGLDPINRLVIKQLLEGFREKGGAVVMSTHQMNQIEEMADRMLMIDRGAQKLYGRVEDIRLEYARHAIVVDGQGDWAALPGVVRVEPLSGNHGGATLYLDQQVTTDQILVAIAQSPAYRIERFEKAIPSLDEIFIQVAGEKADA